MSLTKKEQKSMSKGQLAIVLSKLEGFQRPKVRLEQYSTDPEVAADLLWNAFMNQDLKGTIADLGAGTGILGIGALLLGAKTAYFVESDQEAMKIAQKNWKQVKSEFEPSGTAIFIQKPIQEFIHPVDCVLQNPPFGTREIHADKAFLEKAITITKTIYSLHKETTAQFVNAFTKDHSWNITHHWTYQLLLHNTFAHHTRKQHRILVGIWRLTN